MAPGPSKRQARPVRRQDEEHLGDLQEIMLKRDGYACRVWDAPRMVEDDNKTGGASRLLCYG